MLSGNNGKACSVVWCVLAIVCVHHRVTSKVCTAGNQPLVSGLHFSVLDYQMWSNSNDTTPYPGVAFGEDSMTEMLISYEGRIGADHYRGWCSAANQVEQPFLEVDFKTEVIIEQVETQGLLLNHGVAAARYITGFWLAYVANTTMSFINVTESDSNVTKIFSGQNPNDHTASVLQYLPQPITARIVRIYPTGSIPSTMACVKLELHGCVPQREEECQSVYPLSCCSYGAPGDIIHSVNVTSHDPYDSVPGPVTNILGYNDNKTFWCGRREENLLPINATFYFTEEVLLTSVAFHGLDGPRGDDYVTKYSWEYSVKNSTVETYADLDNNIILENTREDKFQQTFWTPIRVKTLKFVALQKAIRPCMAFKFFGCKINEVISASQMSTTEMTSAAPTSTFIQQLSTDTPASSTSTSTAVLSDSVTPQCSSYMILSSPNCSAVTMTTTVAAMTMTSTVMVTPTSSSSSSSSSVESPTPTPQESVGQCIGNEEPLISGTRYYVSDNQLSASGHDPLHYTYSNMNERVLLVPQEGRISNKYSSFLGWCSQKVTNIVNNAPYIQVDFGTPVVVSSVAVEGFEINSDSRQRRYVHEFQLAYEDLESEKFCTINNDSQLAAVNFTGNTDTNYFDLFKSSLPKPIRAKVFRLYPKSWTFEAVVNDKVVDANRACLKWELYGCFSQGIKAQGSCYPDQISLNASTVNITSNSGSAISTSSLLRFPDNGDNWCPSTEGIDLPLVIDFSFTQMMLLTSLAFTGRKTNDADFFVSSYSLSYATNGSCDLTLYEDLLGHSVFYNDHVRTFFHSFWEPIYVRRLQLLITDWHITPCISVGLFGCSSSEVNTNITTNSGMGTTPSQDVCTAPTNNVLLSCVNVASTSDDTGGANDNSVVTVAIVLPICLAILLLIILILLLYKRLRFKLRSTRLSYSVNNPVFMQSDNPIYERGEKTVKLLDEDQSQHYSRLQHRRDDGAFSSSPYSVLQQQSPQSYTQAGGARESISSINYEEMPYYEIVTSKPD